MKLGARSGSKTESTVSAVDKILLGFSSIFTEYLEKATLITRIQRRKSELKESYNGDLEY